MNFNMVLHSANAIHTWFHQNRELQLARVSAIMSRDHKVSVETDDFSVLKAPNGPFTITLRTSNSFPKNAP